MAFGIGSGQVGDGILDELQVVAKVALLHVLHLAGFLQFFAGVLPDRFQERVSRAGRRIPVDEKEGFVGELLQEVEHVFRAVVRADGFDRLDCASADEDAETVEQKLFGFRQQVVAPVDEGAKGLLVRQNRVAFQELELVVQARGNLGGGENPQPGGGEFEGQRDPVEPPADARDVRRVFIGEPEIGNH